MNEGKQDQSVGLEERILNANDKAAEANRALFQRHGLCAINLISSPGSGKTTLLVETLRLLRERARCAVIEGDQYTDHDAQQIAKTGVPVHQINTQQMCHLDAKLVADHLPHFDLETIDLLFIENVGNLICPSEFDLGEGEKVVLLSVTEGEEKPVKYPLVFHLASAIVVTKLDLIPHLRIDLARLEANIRSINGSAPIFFTSAFEPQTLEPWLDWLWREPAKFNPEKENER